MTTLSIPAPAKLNLFLHITGQRQNGYHDLQTVFQFVDLCDTLHFTLQPDSVVKLSETQQINSEFEETKQTFAEIPTEENLIFRAAQALMPFNRQNLGAHIEYTKCIPSGAGLGGGSSDAATTLLALNQLWQCQQSPEQLRAIGLTLGADVPVFINGHAAFAEGVGEKLTNIDPNTPWYVIIKPNVHISTAEIFSHPDLTRNTPTLKISAALEHGGHNDCENVVRTLYPDVDNAMKWLNQFSPSKLTGTGACVFAAFTSQQEAEQIAKQYRDTSSIFVAKALNSNPAHSALHQQSLK